MFLERYLGALGGKSSGMRIVLLCGLPGSGKSTYLAKTGMTGLSSDHLRQLLIDDASDQTIHAQVFESLRYLLRQRLMLKRPVTYVDATHLTPGERAPYIGMGRAYGAEVEAVFFDTPLEICQERNAARDRVVPEEAMKAMAAKLVPPSQAEGFSRVDLIAAS
jgi:predicted kinase